MKSNLPPHDQHTNHDESSVQPDLLAVPIYASEADHHELWPEYRHVSREEFIRETASMLASRQGQSAMVLKEICATTYRAWLRTHELNHCEASFFLYWCFAPVLRDPVLLAQLGADPAPINDCFKRLRREEPEPALVAQVEELLVDAIIEAGVKDPITILAWVLAAANLMRSDESLRVALVVLAEKVADGLPPEFCHAGIDGAWEKIIDAKLGAWARN